MEEIDRKRIILSAIRGKCPKCYEGEIFRSFLQLDNKCNKCTLDISKGDIGDGAVYIAILLVGTVVTVLAVMLDSYHPMSVFAHILLWSPIVFGASILTLRIAKAVMLALQYLVRRSEFS